MADDLTAILSEWGERFEEELNEAVAEEYDSLERSLSLLAAVEAVLNLTRDGDGDDLYPSIEITVGEVREAITAALTGTARESMSSSTAATGEDGEP